MSNAFFAYAKLGQLWRSVDFSTVLPIVDTVLLDTLQKLLEEQTGDLDRLLEVTLDETDTFRGRAEQRISLARSQIYEFVIAATGMMSYRLIDNSTEFTESDEEWAEIVDFAAKSKKKLKCKPGNIQCGGKCQSGKLNCYADMTPAQKKAAQAAVRKARAAEKKLNQADKKQPITKNVEPSKSKSNVGIVAERLKLNVSDVLDAEEKIGNIASLIAAGESESRAIKQVQAGRFELPSTAKRLSDEEAIDSYGTRENIRATAQRLGIGLREDSDADLATRIYSYYSGTGMKAGASGSAERAAAINAIRIINPSQKLPTPDEAYQLLLDKYGR